MNSFIITDFITFLALLNPFALYLYLIPIQKQVTWREFTTTIAKASSIAGGIYIVSAFFGEALFNNILQINFDSFRIFGGIVLTLFALTYIVQGKKSFITLKGSLDDLAGEIALPFMVGAGTISLSIVIGSRTNALVTAGTITSVMITNFIIVIALAYLRSTISNNKGRLKLRTNTEGLLRINGFLLGAIGIDMIITGIKNLF